MLYWWYENGELSTTYDPDNEVYTLLDTISIVAHHIDGVIVATAPWYWYLVHRLAQEDVARNNNLRIIPGVKLQSVSDYPNYAFRRSTTTWAINTSYTAANGDYPGARVYPTTPNGHSYLCTRGGTSSIVEPTWPTTNGETVMEASGVQWLCQPPLNNSAYLQSAGGWDRVGQYIADYISDYTAPGGGARGIDDYNPNKSFALEYEGLTDDGQWLVLADAQDLSDLNTSFGTAMATHAPDADILWYPSNQIAWPDDDQDELNALWGQLWEACLDVSVSSRLFISNELSGQYNQENAESAGNAADAAQELYQPGTTTIPAINVYYLSWSAEAAAQVVFDNNVQDVAREHYLWTNNDEDLTTFTETLDALWAAASSSMVAAIESSSSILVPPPQAPEGGDRPYRRNLNLPEKWHNTPVRAQDMLQLDTELGDWLQGNVKPDFEAGVSARSREDFVRHRKSKPN